MVLTSRPVSAEIIPTNRICDWTPGVNVGVPGGIPSRTVIGSTVDASVYGTGSADASAALGAAIDACPSGRVVLIPAGTYRLDSRVYRAHASNVTIRGAGMGETILKVRSRKPEWFGSLPWPPFDPANPPGAFEDANVCRIPAGYRYVHGKDPAEAMKKPVTNPERRTNR